MACFHPLTGWKSQEKTASGKRGLIFSPNGAFGSALEIACGQCIGCRLERSRQWSLRLMHEAQFHDQASFLTLTYSEEHLPEDGSLQLRDYQLFLKRLRRALPQRLRFFGCGEYGDLTRRPHYHFILYGEAFLADRKRYSANAQGDVVYTSGLLDSLWGLGACRIGAVTIQSAAYVARYCVKKINGDRAAAHYGGRKPEFMTCSKGIGARWFEQYKSDLYPDDFAVFKGRRMRVPEYYDRKLDEAELGQVKAERKKRALQFRSNNTPERLAVREEVLQARISTLKRNVE